MQRLLPAHTATAGGAANALREFRPPGAVLPTQQGGTAYLQVVGSAELPQTVEDTEWGTEVVRGPAAIDGERCIERWMKMSMWTNGLQSKTRKRVSQDFDGVHGEEKQA